jgi:hypothetical protein
MVDTQLKTHSEYIPLSAAQAKLRGLSMHIHPSPIGQQVNKKACHIYDLPEQRGATRW